jgi:aryl-phospho-beta-D-glucosidase BglC (GH1 family)
MAFVTPVRAGFLHASGVAYADINNQPIALRGVDLGCWLWPEYYMMGNLSLPVYANAGTGSGNINNYYDGLVAAIQDVLGGDTNLTAQVMDAYWTNFISSADIVYLHQQGFNSVRVPYTFEEFFQVTNWANNYPTNGFDINTGFKYLDNLVGWCSTNGIYVIPDMHCAPGGPNNFAVVNYGGTLNTNTASVFTNAANLALAEHIWSRIASHYATNQWIGGYDLLNEPVNTDSGDNQIGGSYISNTYSNLIRTIRVVDANHMFFCEGDAYASTLYDVNLGWTDSNWSFSDHDYGSPLPLSTGNRATAVAYNVPDWAGEFGINSTHWYNRMLATTYQNPVYLTSGGRSSTITEGYCFWAYKSCQEFYTIAQNPQTAGWSTLKAYWASGNTLSKPSVSQAYSWLIGFAQASNFTNCLTHPEIIDSLMRPATNYGFGFSQMGLPYVSGVTIPGKIFAVDYDMGDTNVTYADTVSDDEANEGPGGVAWNSGFFGRSDGVDEESCDDPGTLLKVGWNDAGEWQRHTVNCTPGTYNLYIRYAGGESGAQLGVMLNRNNVSGIVTLPSTGSYTTYSTYVVSNVVVGASGVATLQINVVTPGYDLAWIEFVPASGSPLPPIGETIVGAPATWWLGVQGAGGNASVSLNWVSAEGASSYNIKRATNSGGPYTTVANCAALSYVNMGLLNGERYYYVVSAINGNGESANSIEVNATPETTSLPVDWVDQDVGVAKEWDGDVGDTGWPGSASYNDGVFTVVGSGIDIWNSADSFHYVYRAAAGDCTILSQVTSLQNTDPWAKAGVMIRETLNQDSANAMMLISSHNGSLLSDRPATAAVSSSMSGTGASPYWVKLVRSGNSFTGYVSSSGNAWQQVGSSVVIPMATNVLVGLAVTAHNNTTMCTATFANEAVTGILPSNQPVSLTVTYSPGSSALTLSWPVAGSYFSLYSTPSLVPSITWTPVTNSLVTQNGTLSVTVPTASASQYFRLAAP